MKNPIWKQKTPTDQLTVIRWALRGHLDNWHEGIIDNQKFNEYAIAYLDQIEQLEPFLKGEENW